MSQKRPESIIIVGAGVFGLSTARALSRRPFFSNTKITLLESCQQFPNPTAASVDKSRILRADYGSSVYAALAHEAQKLWRDTNSQNGWGAEDRYHESGFAMISNKGKGEPYVRRCLENLQKMKRDGVEGVGELEILETSTDVDRVTGGVMEGDWGYVNWGSGWSDAEKSMIFAKDTIAPNRVDFRLGAEVIELLFQSEISSCGSTEDEKVSVVGVQLQSGEKLHADIVILATGAWTNKLLDLRGRIEATGQPLTYLSLTKAEEEKLATCPVTMSMATGIYTLPQRDGTLKVGRNSYGYRNPVKVTDHSLEHAGNIGKIDFEVSLPRMHIPLPLEARDDCRKALRGLDMSNERNFNSTRVCWYTDTQAGNFIVAPHPHFQETLFLATGGSGHGFKFLPVIGDKIVDALEGKLDPALAELWAWPKEQAGFGWELRPDGSRGGRIGMNLDEEMARNSL